MRHRIGKGVLLTAAFSLLLTCVFYLAHDTVLHNSRIIGWQAYTAIDLRKPAHSTAGDAVNSTSPPPSTPGVVAGEQYDDAYPLDIYAPTLPNPAPITEITVHSCLPLTACVPPTTPAQDAELGKWVRVDRSLSPVGQLGNSAGGMLSNLFGSIEQRFLFYRKSRRRDVQEVVEIKLVEEGQTPPTGEGWHRVQDGLRSRVVQMMSGEKGLHLFYRTSSAVGRMQAELGARQVSHGSADEAGNATMHAITELDLTYGDNPPWPGFEAAGIISSSHPSMASSRITLTYRRRPMRKPTLDPLKFKKDGSFKILQLADLHFSTTPEPCRDIDVSDPRWSSRGCLAKNDTLSLIHNWLDTEKPDLVVLTGDQLNGQSTSWDPRSVLSLYTAPLISRKIPYAVIFGNHDSESGPLSREEQMQIASNMPYSLSSVGPSLITGTGNYLLKVESGREDRAHVASLWFMDSGTHAEKDRWKPWVKPGYGFIHKDQIEWFTTKYGEIKESLLPYQPDGAADLPKQPWRRGKEWDSDADGGQTLARPPSVVFMHIPPPESMNPPDTGAYPEVHNPTDPKTPPYPSTMTTDLVVGARLETATVEGAQSQPGIFDVLTSLNAHHPAPGGVRLLVHGHMHLNSDCRRVNGIWICFGGGSSLAGYGRKDVQRRARVIVLEQWAAKIRTYHRIDRDDKRADEFVLTYK
ncbi:Phosphoesterase domain protein [Kalmanozyma brasiliensis GHG001]|uniref:Calcineurin-like phosphoesterase domain-containing protein n=1 Tax=Kalmanozyma brasiliensis (strain GHG001) TaxID=1365824 RepID=V5F2H5_KALBG|nr:Phosphoesterase domain protein [Kalmanozyma brasiliensis GHG001]EST09589.1 Phosphoesterase domain protein [Kalmanozyma brasiliensis GHG001]